MPEPVTFQLHGFVAVVEHGFADVLEESIVAGVSMARPSKTPFPASGGAWSFTR